MGIIEHIPTSTSYWATNYQVVPVRGPHNDDTAYRDGRLAGYATNNWDERGFSLAREDDFPEMAAYPEYLSGFVGGWNQLFYE